MERRHMVYHVKKINSFISPKFHMNIIKNKELMWKKSENILISIYLLVINYCITYYPKLNGSKQQYSLSQYFGRIYGHVFAEFPVSVSVRGCWLGLQWSEGTPGESSTSYLLPWLLVTSSSSPVVRLRPRHLSSCWLEAAFSSLPCGPLQCSSLLHHNFLRRVWKDWGKE